jgi:hypothetical protein
MRGTDTQDGVRVFGHLGHLGQNRASAIVAASLLSAATEENMTRIPTGVRCTALRTEGFRSTIPICLTAILTAKRTDAGGIGALGRTPKSQFS